MTHKQRLSLFFIIDTSIVLMAMLGSQYIVNGGFQVYSLAVLLGTSMILFFHFFFASYFKLYKKVWQYASVGELYIIFKVVTLSVGFAGLLQLFYQIDNLFRVYATMWMIHLLLMGGSRFIWRVVRDTYISRNDNRKRTLIIGAGSAGTMLARQLIKSIDGELVPVAFIDDNPNKQNLDIFGIPVAGGIEKIESAVIEFKIEHIIIAIPSLNRKELTSIFQSCAKTNVKTQILPMIEDLVTGKISVNQFRDVQVEDLLGREPVQLNIDSISSSVTDKVVMVTGAGGSIGSEICRQIALFNPKQLILLGHGENSIYSIEMELRETFKQSKIEITTEIADIQDQEKMVDTFNLYRPNVVYHAAAHKHVPLMERNPEEAVKNNIIGTKNVAIAASLAAVETFVMISTDKAVNPTSVMGSTKRLAEMIIQWMDQKSATKFVAVRFGNVLGSRGSVIPLFKKQIENGGPVTVTHPDMVRYFMTIPEASRLVIQASSLARGGEIFVLDMGDPVKIVDLAKNLITLSGNSIEDIGIQYTGMRPGEKLFEELLNENEVHDQQVYPKIYIGKTAELYMDDIEDIIDSFMELDKSELRNRLVDLANNKMTAKSLVKVPV